MCMCSAPQQCVLVVLAFVLLSLPYGFNAATLTKRELIEDNVQNYLMKFGYLSRIADGAGALRTEESVRQAIRNMQKFGGLPETGRLDERTIRLMQKPRCGLPDFVPENRRVKRFMKQGQMWTYTNLTWSLRSKNLQHLDTYQVRHVLMKALEVWSKHSRLTFTELDSDRADILIYFHKGEHGDNYPFDGKGQVLAHAFFPGTGRGGDAHFDEDEVWLTQEHDNNREGTSLFHVAAHEFGHSLGLSHSTVEGALMYPWYQEMGKGFDYELPEDDRLGIQSLYGARGKIWETRRNYPFHRPTTTTTTTTTTTPRPTRRRYHERPVYPEQPPYNPYHPPKPTKPTHHPKKYPMPPKKPLIPTKHPTRHHSHTERVPPPRPTNPVYHPPKPEVPKSKKPDTCDTSYDAIAVIRREVFIFKDAYFWRLNDTGLLAGYPAEITRMFTSLPRNFTHVDAVYERPDNKIVFFIGRQYYVYIGHMLERGYPKPLTHLGLPEFLDKIDGATVWGHNGKTFFFSENLYWRFDEDQQRVELDYPRSMDMWQGVGNNIDAVFQWKDGKTYFFKGKGFWKFNDYRMRVENEEQTPSAPFWMGCSKDLTEKNLPGRKQPFVDLTSSTTSSASIKHILVNQLTLISIILIYYRLIT